MDGISRYISRMLKKAFIRAFAFASLAAVSALAQGGSAIITLSLLAIILGFGSYNGWTPREQVIRVVL